MGERFITVPEFGRIFGVSRATAYNLVKSGKVPSVQLGKSIRVPASVVERLEADAIAAVSAAAAGESA